MDGCSTRRGRGREMGKVLCTLATNISMFQVVLAFCLFLSSEFLFDSFSLGFILIYGLN